MALQYAALAGSAARDVRALVMIVACVPLAYYLAAAFAALRFFRRERAKNLGTFTPPLSILKPVRGVDFASYENFQSFCRQDYPERAATGFEP